MLAKKLPLGSVEAGSVKTTVSWLSLRVVAQVFKHEILLH